ncbi:MAG: hypothetical protein IJW30_00225 [Clostridia bacterium]|nr:hypothetical protein [Clostridia bacterium]
MDNYSKKDMGCVRVPAALCDRTVITELGADFSLPDYQPEMKRLLRVRATVSPPDKYIGVGNAEFSGNVDYCILYAGNDGAMYCANQTGEYRFSVPVEMGADFELGDGLICDVESVPDMTGGRVIAPRRLSLKCRLRSRVRLYGTRLIEEKLIGLQEENPERLRGSAECAQIFAGTGEAMQLADEIVCDTQADHLRVICAEGQVFVSETSAGSGCVNCRGEVALKLLCCRDGSQELPYLQTRRIPFSGSVPVDGVEVNCDCQASGVCSDPVVTVEDGRILCEVSVRLSARAQRNIAVAYTKDLYSTRMASESKQETIVLPTALKCVSGNFSLGYTLPLEEAGIRNDQTVVDLSLIPTSLTLESENGKYVLNGRCRATAILCGESDISVQDFELPFRYETEGASGEVTDYDVCVTPISCRARMDGERIGVDAELAVSIATRGQSEVELLREATFCELPASRGASYTICYPAPDDTLWSVAKRYHRAVSDITSANPIAGSPVADAPDSLDGIHYLLV